VGEQLVQGVLPLPNPLGKIHTELKELGRTAGGCGFGRRELLWSVNGTTGLPNC